MAHTLFCCTRAEGIWKSGYSWIKLDIALPGDVRMHYWQYTPFPRRKNLQSRWRILWCGVGVGGCKGWARSPWVEECMAEEVCGGTNYAQIAPHMGLDVTNN
ncbi:hypothetical protein glysoja_045777 [Glycine soja]|uniref:Uncharacterized protein n=1 Tax=Glycine soja TaxID=3848 RepID=A0A0B2PVF4_GLYSO|nr:hypothetical protein glysoja_045777 [Glycine soja]